MGASESTPTPNNAKEQSVVHIPTTGHTAQQYHAQIVKNFLDLDKKDIYETFGLEGYATIDDISALTRKKHSLLLKYHPDKVGFLCLYFVSVANEVLKSCKSSTSMAPSIYSLQHIFVLFTPCRADRMSMPRPTRRSD